MPNAARRLALAVAGALLIPVVATPGAAGPAGARVERPGGVGPIPGVTEQQAARRAEGIRPRPARVRAPSNSALAPDRVDEFEAIFNRPPFAVPADPTGALGPTQYMTAVNVHVAVYDRGTHAAAFDPPMRLRDLAPFPSGTRDFDPKVVYDHYDDRFILVFLAVNDRRERSWITVATVPDGTAGDPGTWCVRKLKADRVNGDGRQWADYPGLGFSEDRVTITTNQFSFGRFPLFAYAQVLSIPKDELYDCGVAPTITHLFGTATRDPDGGQAFGLQPAVTYGTGAPDRQFLLSFEFEGGFVPSGNRVTVWRIKRKKGGALGLGRTFVRVGRAVIAPAGTQAGGKLSRPNTFWDTGDLRLINAVHDRDLGTLFAAHTVQKDLAPSPYVEAVVRWYEILPRNPLRDSDLVRKGLIGASEADSAWPTLVTDGDGNLFVAFSRAGVKSGEYLSAYVAMVPPGGRAFGETLLWPGEARFEARPGTERWGDFNGGARDPLDPELVVVIGQYAKADAGGPTEDWQQVVDLVRAPS